MRWLLSTIQKLFPGEFELIRRTGTLYLPVVTKADDVRLLQMLANSTHKKYLRQYVRKALEERIALARKLGLQAGLPLAYAEAAARQISLATVTAILMQKARRGMVPALQKMVMQEAKMIPEFNIPRGYENIVRAYNQDINNVVKALSNIIDDPKAEWRYGMTPNELGAIILPNLDRLPSIQHLLLNKNAWEGNTLKPWAERYLRSLIYNLSHAVSNYASVFRLPKQQAMKLLLEEGKDLHLFDSLQNLRDYNVLFSRLKRVTHGAGVTPQELNKIMSQLKIKNPKVAFSTVISILENAQGFGHRELTKTMLKTTMQLMKQPGWVVLGKALKAMELRQTPPHVIEKVKQYVAQNLISNPKISKNAEKTLNLINRYLVTIVPSGTIRVRPQDLNFDLDGSELMSIFGDSTVLANAFLQERKHVLEKLKNDLIKAGLFSENDFQNMYSNLSTPEVLANPQVMRDYLIQRARKSHPYMGYNLQDTLPADLGKLDRIYKKYSKVLPVLLFTPEQLRRNIMISRLKERQQQAMERLSRQTTGISGGISGALKNLYRSVQEGDDRSFWQAILDMPSSTEVKETVKPMGSSPGLKFSDIIKSKVGL